MGGYAPPPEDTAPKTRAEADAQNVVGRRNRSDAGLSGYGGYSDQYLDYLNTQREVQVAQEQQRQQDAQQRQRQAQDQVDTSQRMKYAGWEAEQVSEPSDQLSYEQQALLNVQTRPGYTDPTTLGDTQTRLSAKAVEMMAMMGFDVATPDQMTGRALESQRESARSTPTQTDDRFYSGELQKWAQNKVEVSSAYHDVGKKAGVPIPANRFEYQGDLAVEFLKGSPRKSSERFSPVSGEMSQSLPNGEGLQQFNWREAVAYDRRQAQPGAVSFMGAVDQLGAAEGKYGPYGALYGGDKWMAVNPRSVSETLKMHGLKLTDQQAADFDWMAGNARQAAKEYFDYGDQVKREELITKSQNMFNQGMAFNDTMGLGVTKETTTTIEKPTGALPVFGVVPFISPALATFQPTTERTTTITKGYYGVIGKEESVKQGPTAFTGYVQARLPEGKYTVPHGERNIDKAWNYLLGDRYGPDVSGALNVAAAMIPTSTEWTQQSYRNVREDPLFAAPMVALSVALPASGTVLRSAGVGTKVLTATSRSGQVYQFGSQVASAGLVTLFADYSLKQTSGTGVFDIAQNEYKRAITGGKSQSTLGLMQNKFIGWEAAAQQANKLELEVIAGYSAYTATDYVGVRASQIVKTRGNVRLENTDEFALPSNEGFPVNARITTRDLVESYNQGMMATVNPAKLAKTEWSVTGRRLTPKEYPTNPQTMATAETTDIFSGADTPYLDQGHIGAGHSEIPGIFLSSDAITYFTKPGTGGSGFGISNDILGIYRNPQMYVTGIEAGKSRVIPESVLNTPSRGYSANDPLNPRNLAVRTWMEGNLGYDEVAIGQYGKSEFQFLMRPGGEVTTTRLGYYMDNGMRIPIDRFTSTGKVSPNYVEPPIPTRTSNLFGGVPVISGAYKPSVKSIPYGFVSIIPTSRVTSSQKSSVRISSPFSSGKSQSYQVSSPAYSGSPPSYPSRSGASSSAPVRTVLTPTYTPKVTTPKTPYKTPPYSPVSTPPYSPTKTPSTSRTPTPPYSPPYTPPYSPPKITPVPFGGWSDAPGSTGDRRYPRLGLEKWSNLNPVADIEYLSKGMGSDPLSGGFGAKCRHTSKKLRGKCSRFLRNG